jgi:hypothetical protein
MAFQPDYSTNQPPSSLSSEAGENTEGKKVKDAKDFYNSRDQHKRSAALKGLRNAISKKR